MKIAKADQAFHLVGQHSRFMIPELVGVIRLPEESMYHLGELNGRL